MFFKFLAAVEGAKGRDEGSPTSGAWGWSVERCLSGGGAAVRGWGVLKKRLKERLKRLCFPICAAVRPSCGCGGHGGAPDMGGMM